MKKDLSLWAVFFISPTLCFIHAINKLYKGDYKAAKIIPFIMGLFAYLFPPYSDFARNLDVVYNFQDLPVVYLLAVTADPIVPIIEYYFIKLDIPIEIFRFLYTYYIYFLFTKIYFDIIMRFSLSGRNSFRVWLFLFMIISFFTYIINLRTQFVCYSLLYCVYRYYTTNNNKYRYYSLILCFVHFAYFPIILAFFFSKFIKLNLPNQIKTIFVFLIFFSSFFSGSDFLLELISKFSFGEVIDRKIAIYTDGEWSADGDMVRSMRTVNYIIYKNLSSLSSYYIYYLFVITKLDHKLKQYINLLFIVVIMTAPVSSLFARYVGFFVTTLQLLVLCGYAQGRISSKQINVFLGLCCFNTVLNIYANWNCLVNGNVWYMLLPLPLALCQTYNFEEWCRLHLDNDFNKIINLSRFSR